MFVPVSPDASEFWISQCSSAGCRRCNKLKKPGKRYCFKGFTLRLSFVASFYLKISGFTCLMRKDLCVLI